MNCSVCGEHMLYLWTMMPVCVNENCKEEEGCEEQ
jgi:hypothetical protein